MGEMILVITLCQQGLYGRIDSYQPSDGYDDQPPFINSIHTHKQLANRRSPSQPPDASLFVKIISQRASQQPWGFLIINEPWGTIYYYLPRGTCCWVGRRFPDCGDVPDNSSYQRDFKDHLTRGYQLLRIKCPLLSILDGPTHFIVISPRIVGDW